MKQKLFYILMLFCIAYPMSAQECVLCGDWVGETTFKDIMDGSKITLKRTVRIKQEEGTYSIKMKALRNGEVEYYNTGRIKQVDETSISWCYLDDTEYDWDSSSKYKGWYIGHADYYVHCNVKVELGVLRYTQYWVVLYYNREGQYIGEETFGEDNVYNCILNKEEENW